jgi:hypothetical protein
MLEAYLGIEFTIRDAGNGAWAWTIRAPLTGWRIADTQGTVEGGQNEAILAARKAIGRLMKGAALSQK